MNVSDVIKEADPKKEFISIEKGDINLVMVFDHNALVKKNEKKIVRLYKLGDDGETVTSVDVDYVIQMIVDAVQNDVDVKELLTEVFKNTPPDLLMKIGANLHSSNELPMEVEASSEPVYHCCYSLIFGDKTKPGHIEIPISGGRYDRGG
jgi:hypothetical protein